MRHFDGSSHGTTISASQLQQPIYALSLAIAAVFESLFAENIPTTIDHTDLVAVRCPVDAYKIFKNLVHSCFPPGLT